MPWKIEDVEKHKKGLTLEQKKQWVKIANNALKYAIKNKIKNPEAYAIRVASSRVGKRKMWKNEDMFKMSLNLVKAQLALRTKIMQKQLVLDKRKYMNLKVKIHPVAGFSNVENFNLPLRISGELIRPGTYYSGVIEQNQLKEAFLKLVSKGEILLFTSHNAYWKGQTNTNDVVGKLENFKWDDLTDSIIFDGWIVDESTARKILSGLVKGISAGFTYDLDTNSNKNFNIDIREGTLTFRPHCKTAYIKAVG